ncbi:16S rRNA (guanine(527)-N(7))-methyltransferase RsmG [Acidiluteibacter ferrifornacis]|uniref:Ribosomal RNA small subunit methyltransferase G n=1 Tax=Acidiluteibacter ferrifornacis TaxID=2692424 RepID=A0A6N9NKY2_9FLAO|nr:16S rRNA (guanine(527)-N(7))-methyltransferase RsmG [Acidiluteibacter ferrifornacis]MBR9832495.1 16S rRNA (guanine(527)-N(7))-methyltransferase RsmG [bacterium]NBG66519.1 16S rRNA (guanine(527)-N(7))-methyltransferase RsmG [Acidiluteibacter ferrifornacis]
MNTEIITKYFPNLSEVQKQQFSDLQALYEEWNAQINVISRKDMDELYIRHILHALGIAKVIQFKPQTTILDVGTGGGFPGIPLAIMFPECDFHLVDAIGKKIKVVNAVAEGIGLTNLTAAHQRAEKVEGKFDFIVSRAVTRTAGFIPWVQHKIKKGSFNELDNGFLFLKGGDLEEELNEVKSKYKIYDLSNYFDEEFFETKKVVHMTLS